ncbi:MAG: CoA ester lyase, partial [Pseudomonadota bacterium]
RVNALGTPWGGDDLAMAARSGCDAILLPKVESSAMLEAASAAIDNAGGPPDLALWAMIETPRGVLAVERIARHPRLTCLVLGTNDLVADMRAEHVPGRGPVLAALTMAVLAARASGLAVLDGVYNAFRDEEGLREECEQGRALGMDGKTVIHPAQLAVTNDVFAPAPEAVDLARRQIAALEAAQAEGRGVAVVDGRIVEGLHARSARRLIAEAEAIAKLEASTATA